MILTILVWFFVVVVVFLLFFKNCCGLWVEKRRQASGLWERGNRWVLMLWPPSRWAESCGRGDCNITWRSHQHDLLCRCDTYKKERCQEAMMFGLSNWINEIILRCKKKLFIQIRWKRLGRDMFGSGRMRILVLWFGNDKVVIYWSSSWTWQVGC